MSKQPSVDIDSAVQLRLLVPHQAPRPLSATLKFRSCDPYAVTVCFRGAGETVEWVFARDLLSQAVNAGFAGEGDVRVRLLVPPGQSLDAACDGMECGEGFTCACPEPGCAAPDCVEVGRCESPRPCDAIREQRCDGGALALVCAPKESDE